MKRLVGFQSYQSVTTSLGIVHLDGSLPMSRLPVVDGVVMARIGRDQLIEQTLSAVQDGDRIAALRLLLNDRDDFDRQPPARIDAIDEVIATVDATVDAAVDAGLSTGDDPSAHHRGLRDSANGRGLHGLSNRRGLRGLSNRRGLHGLMRRLNYGGVADYFAVRPSTPTFLSGLQLVRTVLGDHRHLIDVGCGIGQLTGWIGAAYTSRGCPPPEVTGIDAVFSKLWLARHFFLPNVKERVMLVCADVAGPLPIADGGGVGDASAVICHDAFYFFDDKPAVLSELLRLAGPNGTVGIGHIHHAATDRHGVGHAEPITNYRTLFDSGRLAGAMADESLSDDAIAGRQTEVAGRIGDASVGDDAIGWNALESAEAVSVVLGDARPAPIDVTTIVDASLKPNPILRFFPNAGGGVIGGVRCEPVWPSANMADEYVRDDFLRCDDASSSPADVHDAIRRRIWLPERFAIALDPPANDVNDNQAPRELSGRESSGRELSTRVSSTWRRRLNWAVVGCGWVARDYGIPAILNSPSSRLLRCIDPSAESLRRVGESIEPGLIDPVKFQTNADDADWSDIDAVYLATPNHLHRVWVERLAAAGVAVLCEKPIAISPGDAIAMAMACRNENVLFRVAYDQRHHPAHHALRRMIAAGALGRITQIRIHYACWLPPAWSPDEHPHDNWRVDASRSGGGAVVDLAPHGVDLVEYLSGSPTADLSLHLQNVVHDYQRCDDGGLTTVVTQNGVLASIHNSYACPDDLPRRRLEVIGTDAMAIAENTMGQTPGGRLTVQFSKRSRIVDQTARSPIDADVREIDFDCVAGPFENQIECFVDDLRRFGQNPVAFHDQADAMVLTHERLIAAITSSPIRRSNPPTPLCVT